MSSTLSEKEDLKTKDSYSDLYQQNSRSEIAVQSKSFDLSSGDSTSSLLSPIYHESYESEDEENESPNKQTNRLSSRESKPTPKGWIDSASKRPVVSTPHRPKESRFKASLRKAKLSEEEEQRFKEVNLTAWEKWLIKKAKEERIKTQNKSQQEMILKQAKLKEQEELERKKILAEDEHKRWVQRKDEKEKMEKEMKLHKEQEGKKARERERGLTAERASEKFQEWLKKKKLQKMETKKIEKDEEEKRTAETQERKEKADQVYQEWLEKVKARPRTVASSFGYANGKLTGYYDGSSYPAPSYYNPIPWKPIPVPCLEDTTKKLTCKMKEKPKSSYLYKAHSNMAFRPKDNLLVGTAWRKAR
ncbi:coiled-coil domain-containing protein 34-like isoform X2 [Heterodontus francisci]|uniref:coiled-coil domain-containing protein 34-like isoform X2 n=1 Tax=Heterodontus francisci TaxID=7792 RepID=UPI00355AE7B3